MEQSYFPGEREDEGSRFDDDTTDSSEEEDDVEDYEKKKVTPGDVYAFGYGFFGQLGSGGKDSSAVPRLIPELKNIVQVSCGEAHSIAVTETGIVYSWGCNRYGQLGVGDNTHRYSPVVIEAMKGMKVTQSSCGVQHTLLLTKSGEIYSFGCGSFGRLGHGDHKHLVLPRLISALRGRVIVKIAADGWFSVCISNKGKMYSWGANRYGQTGHGKVPVQLFPRQITSLFSRNITHAACGKNHTVVYTDAGECLSFGAGTCGQLGNRSKKHSTAPVVVDLKHPILELACGYQHSLALTPNGLYTWGYISDDQLGLSESGEEYHSAPLPVYAPNVKNISTIAAGGWHNALITKNGELYTWGFAYKGRLGYGNVDEDQTHPISPQLVESLLGKHVTGVACGGAHTLVIAVCSFDLFQN